MSVVGYRADNEYPILTISTNEVALYCFIFLYINVGKLYSYIVMYVFHLYIAYFNDCIYLQYYTKIVWPRFPVNACILEY